MITISRAHALAIRLHGQADYPHECCGLLLGAFDTQGDRSVRQVLPISNAREQSAQHNRFLITPQDLLRGERHARAANLDVIGFYHSHPDCPAVPSQFDLDHAWPVYSYLILSVTAARAAELRSWQLRADRSQFDPEPLQETV